MFEPERILNIIHELGKQPNRLAIQHKIYFIQELGHDMGWGFKWRLGPYCDLLAVYINHYVGMREINDGVGLVVNTIDTPTTGVERVYINTVRSLTKGLTEQEIDHMAAVHFLVEYSHLPTDQTEIDAHIDKERGYEQSGFVKDVVWQRLYEFGMID